MFLTCRSSRESRLDVVIAVWVISFLITGSEVAGAAYQPRERASNARKFGVVANDCGVATTIFVR